MDLRQIEYIITIEQEQSISKAATKLYITQSALNQQLLKLEKELGTPLFERKKHTMIPTYAGRIYLETAHKMIELKESTYKVIHDISNENNGEIRVAFTPEKGALMFTDVYPVFHARYPDIRFRIQEARVMGMEKLVLNKEVSFAISTTAPGLTDPQLRYTDLVTEKIYLIVPTSNPLSALAGSKSWENPQPIDLKHFEDYPFVLPSRETRLRQLVDRMQKANNMHIQPLFETSSTGTVIRMVENQLCNGFVPQSYVVPNESLVYFLPQPEEYWNRSIITLPDTYLTKAEQYFIELVKLSSSFKSLEPNQTDPKST